MKRALVILFAGASVFAAGTAHAACAGSKCLDIKPVAYIHSEDACDNTGSAGCCFYYTWSGEEKKLACL